MPNLGRPVTGYPVTGYPITGYRAFRAAEGLRHCDFSTRSPRLGRLSQVSLPTQRGLSQKASHLDTLSCILMMLVTSLLIAVVLGFFATAVMHGTGSYSIIELLRGLCC